ncbi:hypothetical protein PR002_g468 [Phytophthora rubi]|uniref:Uncharacterized protein n=1 Tax=Phytophthora rubi TaxID=129364 RepID=A0A6A3P3Z4_9STRA|nr:hypothetical protein PR002_g468 [Phytophthora rubi]
MDHPVRAATGSRALAKSPPFSDLMDVSREFRARRMLRMPTDATPTSMQVRHFQIDRASSGTSRPVANFESWRKRDRREGWNG